MPQFQHVEKADLAVGTLDIEALADYITNLERYYAEPESGALVLVLGQDDNKREETKKLKQAYKVLQARGGNAFPENGLVVKARGQKLVAEIVRNAPAKVSRPRRTKASAA